MYVDKFPKKCVHVNFSQTEKQIAKRKPLPRVSFQKSKTIITILKSNKLKKRKLKDKT